MKARIYDEYGDPEVQIWEGPEWAQEDDGEWRAAKPEEVMPAMISIIARLQRKLRRLGEND